MTYINIISNMYSIRVKYQNPVFDHHTSAYFSKIFNPEFATAMAFIPSARFYVHRYFLYTTR